MPSPIPTRDRSVFFVGAGLSCALGLPNTASLITELLDQLGRDAWRHSARLGELMTAAFRAFYPDARDQGFRPETVDFFSAVKMHAELFEGYPGGLKDAPELYRRLKFGLAHLLLERLRDCDSRLEREHAYLEDVVQRGNIVVTSNWDLGLERYAKLHNVPVRLRGHRDKELVVLKLHGSIDWTLGEHMRTRSRRIRFRYVERAAVRYPSVYAQPPERWRAGSACASDTRSRKLGARMEPYLEPD